MEEPVAPPESSASSASPRDDSEPERVMFDKADAAERLAQAEKELGEVRTRLAELEKEGGAEVEIERLRAEEARLVEEVARGKELAEGER